MKYKHDGIWSELIPSLSWNRPWHMKEDNEILCRYANKIEGCILEIGSAEGQSGISMLLASENFLVMIEPFVTTNLLTNIKSMELGDRVMILPTTSEKAILPPVKFELIFIDGVHTYDMVKHDMEKFSKTEARYIILHDTNKPEIEKAVKEFIKLGTYENIEQKDNIVVLERKEK